MTTMTDTVRSAQAGASTATDLRGSAAPRWHYAGFRAMNSTVTLDLYSADERWPAYVEGLFATTEARLSRFRPESELAHVNRQPAGWTPVSFELFAALEAALWGWRATNGLYDPAMLNALEAAGYDRSFEQISQAAGKGLSDRVALADEPAAALPCALRQEPPLRLDHRTRSVQRRPGSRLDLGGMGKGWTVDRAADLLSGVGPFLLNAGGDIYAHGFPTGSDKGWLIDVEDPADSNEWLARLRIANGAVATSSITRRRWQGPQGVSHHLLDPRTGQPTVSNCMAATVIAPRAVEAEIHAKVALILGLEEGTAYLERLPGIEGLLAGVEGQLDWTPGFVTVLAEIRE